MNEKIQKNKQNIIVFIFWLVIGIYVTIEALRLGTGTLNEPGSGFFLFFTGIGILVFSVIWLISDFVNKINNNVEYNKAGFKRMLLMNLLLVIYILLIDKIGFIVTTFLFLLTFFRLLESVHIVKSLIISTVTVLIIYFVFTKLLELRLPEGILL